MLAHLRSKIKVDGRYYYICSILRQDKEWYFQFREIVRVKENGVEIWQNKDDKIYKKKMLEFREMANRIEVIENGD